MDGRDLDAFIEGILFQRPPNCFIEAQKSFCKRMNVPNFVPEDGHCYACEKDIFSGKRGYTKAQASSELITGCPHCFRSFVD